MLQIAECVIDGAGHRPETEDQKYNDKRDYKDISPFGVMPLDTVLSAHITPTHNHVSRLIISLHREVKEPENII